MAACKRFSVFNVTNGVSADPRLMTLKEAEALPSQERRGIRLPLSVHACYYGFTQSRPFVLVA